MTDKAKENRLAHCKESYGGDAEKMHREHFLMGLHAVRFDELVAGEEGFTSKVLREEFGGDAEAMRKEHYAYCQQIGRYSEA